MKKCFLILLAAVIFPPQAIAQAVEFGVVGGVPLTPVTPRYTHNDSRPYLIGPSIEFRLPASFAIEVDGIYRRIGSNRSGQFNSDTGLTSYSYRTTGNSWEVPVLGKYYFQPRHSLFRPFIASGFSLRTITENSKYVSGPNPPASSSFSSRDALDVGAVVAAGLHFKPGRFSVDPQFRYSRWGSGNNNRVSKNQTGFVLGIRF